MSKIYLDEKVEIILWLNGKEVDYSFKLTIPTSTKSNLNIKYLKELIIKTILSNKDLNAKFSHYYSEHNIQIYQLYNQKEILLEDSDIQYLKQNEIIFFTFDNSSFKSSNHFNQYQFIKWIKSGGYGQVFLSKHVCSEKEYAIKQIDTTSFSNEDLYNISREYMILRSMMHKNVIKCYDSFAHNNKFYTVMDYAEGGELSTLLKEKGVLSEQDSKKIFKQIYEAVCFIHSQNIIHRDLKPNNILFLDKERTHVVVIDFGISGFANGNQREKIKAGTTSFLPPEMASGEEYSSNRKLDIWALGVILYRMVEGVYPFEGKNTKEIIINILKGKLEFNKKIKISYPLRTLIEGLLEKNHRFRIDDDSELFSKWFEFSPNTIKKKKTIDEKQSKKKNENHCNYLTPTKSTALKRLPTQSYNSFYQNQKQNLMNKFKEGDTGNNSINIKVNSNNNINNNNNYDIYTQYKVMRKNSLYLPLLNKKGNSNLSINNEVNGFRRPHKKSVEQKKSNISINQANKNNINNENNIIREEKEKNNEDDLEYISINDVKSLYKTKVNSCKQVRVKKHFKND
jgi:serine/threonine protein kinase